VLAARGGNRATLCGDAVIVAPTSGPWRRWWRRKTAAAPLSASRLSYGAHVRYAPRLNGAAVAGGHALLACGERRTAGIACTAAMLPSACPSACHISAGWATMLQRTKNG